MEDFKYSPADGIMNREFFPSHPVDENAARAQFQNMYAQILDFLNVYKNALQKNTGEDSGASLIGSSTIPGLPGNDVHSQIAALNARLDLISNHIGLGF